MELIAVIGAFAYGVQLISWCFMPAISRAIFESALLQAHFKIDGLRSSHIQTQTEEESQTFKSLSDKC